MILERRTVTLKYNHNCLSHGKSQARCPPFYLGLLQPQLCLAWCSSYASSCPQWRIWPTERDSVHKVNQQHGRDSWRKDILLDPGERHSSYLLELSSVVTPALSGSSLSHSHLFIDLSDSYLSMFSNLPMILSSYSFSSSRSCSRNNVSLVILCPGTGEMALWLGAYSSPRGPELSPGLTKV